ncbi:hypothetical protein [Pseudanabaena sp. PCC 6802]|uniref:hypothetical protein n=1 Tax=Pseudanabaena sp. PCC 6802 TaxID=118173 RepID=UPI00034C43CA|nr:hypothetical protein [Pseudanabaena sp. PCC 6802]
MATNPKVKADLKFTQIDPRTWSTVGTQGNVYTLSLLSSSLHCNCPAGRHRKNCYHADRLAQLFKAELNDCLASF